jgi:hypothetical protein
VIKKIAYRLLGLALLLISALTWFWMLVGFEIFFPAQVVVDLGRDAEWLHPGARSVCRLCFPSSRPSLGFVSDSRAAPNPARHERCGSGCR